MIFGQEGRHTGGGVLMKAARPCLTLLGLEVQKVSQEVPRAAFQNHESCEFLCLLW